MCYTVCTYIAYLRRATSITTCNPCFNIGFNMLKIIMHTIFNDSFVFFEVLRVRKEILRA